MPVGKVVVWLDERIPSQAPITVDGVLLGFMSDKVEIPQADAQSSKPLISALIPSYRRPRLLRRAIRSVLAQTYPHLQVSVYDNASGDETASVVAELARNDPRVKYHCHAENIGSFRNFAYAMDHVQSPFFSFLSDDDFLLPNFYETAVSGFERHPEAIFSALLTLVVDDQCRLRLHKALGWKAGFYTPPQGLLAFLRNGFLTWTGMLFRREVMEKVGMLDPQAGDSDDTEYVLRIVTCFPFVVSAQAGAVFMVHPGSGAYQTRFESVWPGALRIIEGITQNEHIPQATRDSLKDVLREWHIKEISRWCAQFILWKDFESARKTTNLLRELYGLNGRAWALETITRTCEHFPPAHRSAYYLDAFRQALRDSRLPTSDLPLDAVRRAFHLGEFGDQPPDAAVSQKQRAWK